jgi:two-component system CheB/CheR fusion protein
LERQIPAIILTGDAGGATSREIALQHCVQLTKPVRVKELIDVIDRLLPATESLADSAAPDSAGAAGSSEPPVVFIVDDDSHVRQDIRAALEENGCAVEDYGSSEAFLEAYRPGRRACLLIDAYLPGLSGLQLLDQLERTGDRLPAIMITGNSDVSMAVQAMKAGASDFIEKPISNSELLASVGRALEQSRQGADSAARRTDAMSHLAHLTPRQAEIMERVLAGHSNKHIAADLGISQRTVENHRASIMKRTGSTSLPGLARLALTANRSANR